MWLRALLAPFNTKTIGNAGAALFATCGATIGKLLFFTPAFVVALFGQDSSGTIGVERAQLMGLFAGLCVGFIMGWIGYAPQLPTPPSEPPDGDSAEPVPLKRAA